MELVKGTVVFSWWWLTAQIQPFC